MARSSLTYSMPALQEQEEVRRLEGLVDELRQVSRAFGSRLASVN
jgi:hypothetical protein